MQENLLRFQKQKKFLYLDCETLNLCLNYSFNLPWQIATMEVVDDKILPPTHVKVLKERESEDYDDGIVINSNDILIKWKTHLRISQEAAVITRYSQEKVDRFGRDPQEAFDILYPRIESCDYIIGHNTLGFDIYLVYELFKLFNKDPRKLVNKFLDTNCFAKAIKLGLAPAVGEPLINFQYRMQGIRQKGLKTRLEIIAKEYEIEHEYDRLHDALVDLTLNKKVWEKQRFQLDI